MKEKRFFKVIEPFFKRIKKDKIAILSLLIIFIVCIAAIFSPYLSPYPFDAQDSDAVLKGPSIKHLMGTDRLGRDLLSRIIYGARISMLVGIVSSLLALTIGTIYGAISGLIGGRTDNLMMRIVDVIYSLPDLLLIILFSVVIGRSLSGIFLALALVSWVTIARLVRGEVLRLKEQIFIEAARGLGASNLRIIFFHLLPNTLGPLIVTLTLRIPSNILAESTLSFVGLGISPPFSSWGTLANDGWSAIKFYPHLIIFPSITIFLTILSFNFLGDLLRDFLDPEMSYR